MAWTSTDLDNLKSALASGELSVRIGDKSVTYRSISELRSAISTVEADINSSTRTRVVKLYTATGY